MATQQDVIKNFVKALGTDAKGVDLLDAAVKAASGGGFSSWEALRTSYISAVKTYSGTTEIAQKAFLKKYCGIDLDDKDTGSITGSSAGGLLVKTAESIVENSSSAMSFPTNAVTDNYIRWPEKSSLSVTQQKIAGRLYNDWIPGSLQLIKDSFGIEARSTTEVEFYSRYDERGRAKGPIYFETHRSYTGNNTSGPVLHVYTNYYDYFHLENQNGVYGSYIGAGDSGDYLDRMTAHALAHKVLLDNYSNAASLPEEVAEGLIGLVTGVDDLVSKNSFLWCANKDYAEYSVREIIQKKRYNSFSNTFDSYDFDDYKNIHEESEGISAYVLLRYLAKQTATSNVQRTIPAGTSYDTKKTTITAKNTFTGTIDARLAATTVSTINAAATTKSVTLRGNTKNNVMRAGSGGNTLRGDKGNDTLYGGKGKDTFIYADGDGIDTIYNYEAGKDVLSLISGKITKTTVSGADVIFTVNKGSIRVKNGVLKNIVLMNSQGQKTTKKLYYNLPSTAIYNANKTTITLKDSASGTIDLGKYMPSVTTVNAKAAKKSLTIYGNAKANVIYAGKAGGNIRGKAGNDKIYCGAGTDKIYFGKTDGQDQIIGSSKRDIAYFYGIKDIKQITAKKSGSVMKLGIKGTKDTMSIAGWTSSAGLNTVQLSNGIKYRLSANGTFKKI